MTGALVVALAAGQSGAATPPPQTPPTQAPQTIFRSNTNLVTVDAYPRRDGRIVEGLKPGDFEVLEDGVAQAVDQFEFVRVEPAPEAERRDPNTQREMLQLAADPHNRVFVTYLDTYHVGIAGSHDIRGPLVDMLNRIVAPNDLFGVTTSKMPPTSLVLGRKLLSVEEQLTRYWPWGERNRLGRDPDDAKEDYLNVCFDVGQLGDKRPKADDEGVSRAISDILMDRRREEGTLANFRALVSYVGTFREARTLVVLVTDGWRLFRQDPQLQIAGMNAMTAANGGHPPDPTPPIGVNSAGRLGAVTELDAHNSDQACRTELARLALLDDQREFRDIIALANRNNVVVYPVNPGGLEALDTNIAQTKVPLGADMDRHTQRVDSALTLASNTDGIAVVGTNDLRDGLARIVNDVSAYYLIGYYSTNARADGKYRQIKVRVRQQNVAVAARRGYVAPAAVSASATTAVPAAPSASAGTTDALGTLSRLGAGSDLFTYGVVSGTDLVVVAEIASGQVELGRWLDGATMKVVVTGPAGERVGTASGRIEAGSRAALVRVPFGAVAGPWHAAVTVTGTSGSLDERLDVRVGGGRLIADPILYRGTGAVRAVLRPVADFLYHRTERVHVEWPTLKPLDQRTARVLDRRGQPVPVAATLTERDDAGQAVLIADLNLAQLSPGDYVLEVSVASGSLKQSRQVAIRVVR
jgi:VWFA-related protein